MVRLDVLLLLLVVVVVLIALVHSWLVSAFAVGVADWWEWQWREEGLQDMATLMSAQECVLQCKIWSRDCRNATVEKVLD